MNSASKPAPSSQRRLVSLVVVVIALLTAGGLLFVAVEELVGVVGTRDTAGANAGSIHEAAWSGQVGLIRQEAGRGISLNTLYENGENLKRGKTPLMLAAFNGQEEAARALLEAGANVNAAGRDKLTPLMCAAGWSEPDLVQAMLDGGANVNARDRNGWTALMFAASRGDDRSVQALIDAGASVSERNKWGQTALIAASRSGHTSKAAMLLNAGADVNAADEFGDTALIVAASSPASDASLLKTLIESARAEVNVADRGGVTPLMHAAGNGDLEKVNALLAGGADVAVVDGDGWTAKDWAEARDDDIGRQIAERLSR